MTKKEKILHSYITNIIEDENPKNIFILTSQDVSKLIKRIEKLRDFECRKNGNFKKRVQEIKVHTSAT